MTFPLLASFSVLPHLAINLLQPAVPTLAKHFHATAALAAAPMTFYLAGLALGQLFMGPWSDRVGRRFPLLTGLALLCGGSVLAAVTDSYAVFLLGRMVQALGGSAVLVAGRAAIGDLYEEAVAARCFSGIMVIVGLEPILTPTAGASLLAFGGWRSVFAAQAVLTAGAFLLVLTLFPESRLQHPTAAARTLRGYAALLRNSRVMGLLLINSLSLVGFFSYLAVTPLVMMQGYKLTPHAFGIVAAVNAVAQMGGAQLNRLLLASRAPMDIMASSSPFFAALGLALIGFAITQAGGFWMLLVLVFLANFVISVIQSNALACTFAAVPERAGSAAALFGAASFATGTLVSLAAGVTFDGTARGLCALMATGLLGTAVALAVLVGKKHGTRLRSVEH